MKPLALLASHVLVAGAAVGVYHVAVAQPGQRASETRAADAARALIAQIPKPRPAPPPSPDSRTVQAVERLEARLRALEEKAGIPPPPEPPAPPSPLPAPPTTPGSPSPSWTEDQLTTFRAMVDEIERRKQEERELDMVRRRIQAQKVALTPDEEQRAVELGVDYMRRVRELMPRGATAADRQAGIEKMAALHEELRASLSGFLSADAATAVLKAFPGAPSAPGPRPR